MHKKYISLTHTLCHELCNKTICIFILILSHTLIIINHLRINLGLQATYMEMGSIPKFKPIYQLCVEKNISLTRPLCHELCNKTICIFIPILSHSLIIINHLRINLASQATYMEMGSVSKLRPIYQLCLQKFQLDTHPLP